jgi:hypothetical protein
LDSYCWVDKTRIRVKVGFPLHAREIGIAPGIVVGRLHRGYAYAVAVYQGVNPWGLGDRPVKLALVEPIPARPKKQGWAFEATAPSAEVVEDLSAGLVAESPERDAAAGPSLARAIRSLTGLMPFTPPP